MSEQKIPTKNPTGHLVVAPDGRVATLPPGQPLKEGWRYATSTDVKAAGQRAEKNAAEEAWKANRDRVAAHSIADALSRTASEMTDSAKTANKAPPEK
jgi:hypothetical protein